MAAFSSSPSIRCSVVSDLLCSRCGAVFHPARNHVCVSARDKERLALGAKVMANPDATEAELSEAVAAMQSLDDLGTAEANEAAWRNMLTLLDRMSEATRKRLEAL